MIELISRMKSEVDKTCKSFKGDLDIDIEVLTDDFGPCRRYIWVVKEAGTELMIEDLAFCKDHYYSVLAYGCTEDSGNRAFIIDLMDRKDGEIYGEITEIDNLKSYLDLNQMTPETIKYKYRLRNGITGEQILPYTQNYFEELLSILDVRREEVDRTSVVELF